MKFHKEGKQSIYISSALLLIVVALAFQSNHWTWSLACLLVVVLWILILQFFRNPDRSIDQLDEQNVFAPADGKVVAIEEILEDEFFNEKRKMISIFMSPLNVHVNRASISGTYAYAKHHKGKYLAAWNPKSSTENERTTIVIEGSKGTVMLRQIAGALARRIVMYAKKGETIKQGEEIGFIKFGSRVDVYLPLDAEVLVKIDQVVKGNIDVVAKL